MEALDARIDTRFYHGDDRYRDGEDVEKELLELVSSHSEEECAEIALDSGRWPLLYHLSPVRENILNWIPWQPGEKVLELGAGCGAVTGACLKKGMEVTTVDLSLQRSKINAARHPDAANLRLYVGASEEVLPALEEKFDVVTLIGVLEYAAQFSEEKRPFHHLLLQVAKVLKEHGSVWIAIENKLGLKYFAGCREDHTGRYFEGIEGYPHHDGPYTFSRKELRTLAEECGYSCRFFYPYPDYKFPICIYSDEYLPKKGQLTRNWQTFDGERISVFDESRVFDTIIEAGLFPELSNSFLLELRRA